MSNLVVNRREFCLVLFININLFNFNQVSQVLCDFLMINLFIILSKRLITNFFYRIVFSIFHEI